MDADTELVIYRVAQEGLTNAVRHARASRVEVSLQRTSDGVELRVVDDGRGVADTGEGAGIRGMRERALLIGAQLAVTGRVTGGTEVRLGVPIREEGTPS